MRKFARLVGAVLSTIAVSASAQNCGAFSDVDAASPFCGDVTWMANRGITLGCGAGQYCPNNTVTRLQMAAFLHRLATALSPAGILWVAPQGAEYTTVQSAIDAAGLIATLNNPVLVKIAPGTYSGQVTLKDYVSLQGSGQTMTEITHNGAGGTMIAGAASEVGSLTVSNTFAGAFPGAVAVYQAGNTAAGGFTLFTEVQLAAIGTIDNVGMLVTGGNLSFEGRSIGSGSNGGTGVAVGVHATGAGTFVRLRRALVGASATASTRYSGRVDAGASLRIADTQLDGDTLGTPACINTYTPQLVPKNCL